MKTVIIGSGNTATALGRLINTVGHEIVQVFSRNSFHAEDLAEELGCESVSDWQQIDPDAELYIVALSDSALANLHENWQAKSGLVVHTAGALSIDVLEKVAENRGVLYPLQSLRKEKSDYDSIPLLTDANTPENLEIITEFAESLSTLVRKANDEARMHLHISAVIVNNFSNYLFTLTEDYCNKNGVQFSLLQPLIAETAERIKDFSPRIMQTGPAARADMSTIERHTELLQNSPALLEFYQLFTKRILKPV
jgi:predicted short-subunit dehydrogenase-like oxidoreductase (DUF2520 family)